MKKYEQSSAWNATIKKSSWVGNCSAVYSRSWVYIIMDIGCVKFEFNDKSLHTTNDSEQR